MSSDRMMSSDRRNQISEESLPTYVEDLRSLASSLGTSASRDTSSNQLRGLELLSAIIRAKTRMISNDAGSPKARTRLRRLREGEKKDGQPHSGVREAHGRRHPLTKLRAECSLGMFKMEKGLTFTVNMHCVISTCA